jgi:hypothetical protein
MHENDITFYLYLSFSLLRPTLCFDVYIFIVPLNVRFLFKPFYASKKNFFFFFFLSTSTFHLQNSFSLSFSLSSHFFSYFLFNYIYLHLMSQTNTLLPLYSPDYSPQLGNNMNTSLQIKRRRVLI